MSTETGPQVGHRVVYHPLPTRSPELRNLTGQMPVIVKLADDGRAMLLFADLHLTAAVPDEFTEDDQQ